ncbi:Mur ligase family protein [Psychromonas sp. MME2]|uniref:UDP-N-acetylmuramoyl-tripeptide--D-alanyl-D- alanine ligase n=1 Tax=unclassified Psychromonas TaxID=2614957 RepID=UPI00339BFAA8
MLSLSVAEIALATGGDIFNEPASELVIDSVCTDSRNVNMNSLFIALQGASFDAHAFIDDVESRAALLLVHRKVNTGLPYILVKDTRIALGLLGAYVRDKIEGLKCAAITGSNGKTTTKELLSQILRQHDPAKDAVLATAGNFNNDIGLPLTLLRLSQSNHFAVVELGANHPGEIAYTAKLAKPDVALINNVMPAHLEGFGIACRGCKSQGRNLAKFICTRYCCT